MKLPLEITFRHMDHDAELEALVRRKAEKLETFVESITRCRVVVEPTQVHVQVTLPGGEVDAKIDPGHKGIPEILGGVFDSAGRQLQDHVRRRRGSVKVHTE
jgi:hypothetical protein